MNLDPVYQMKLEEKRAAVELDKLQQQVRDLIEKNVRERLGKRGQVLPLEFYPRSSILTQTCKPIPDGAVKTSLFKKLFEDMRFTMYMCGGVGLAAPQIGLAQRLFVADWSEKRSSPVVVVNPSVVWTSDESSRDVEACLSMPGVKVNVTRPTSIGVRFLTETGRPIKTELVGWAARVFLHELDHLDRRMMLDHASVGRLERRRALKVNSRIAKGEKPSGLKPKRKKKLRRR